jgi:hypothetical protein
MVSNSGHLEFRVETARGEGKGKRAQMAGAETRGEQLEGGAAFLPGLDIATQGSSEEMRVLLVEQMGPVHARRREAEDRENDRANALPRLNCLAKT